MEECGREAEGDSSLPGGLTGRIVQLVESGAAMGIGSHGVIATKRTRSSGVAPFSTEPQRQISKHIES